MKAHMIRKMSEVIQKQRNQSLNIQKQSFKGVLIKRRSEIYSKFTGEHLCQNVKFPCRWKAIKPDKPGLWKTWTQKNLDPEKHEFWKIWCKYGWGKKMSAFRELCFINKDHARCDLLLKSSQRSKLNFSG